MSFYLALTDMRRIKFIFLIALAVLACAVGTFIVLDFFLTGIKVSITNNGPAAVKDVRLYHRGGVGQAKEIGSHSIRRFKIKVRGKSDLNLEFFDNTGKSHKYSIDVYLAGSESGRMDIMISEDYQIKWTMELKLFWFSTRPPLTISGVVSDAS